MLYLLPFSNLGGGPLLTFARVKYWGEQL